MKKRFLLIYSTLIFLLLLNGCSSTQPSKTQTTSKESKSLSNSASSTLDLSTNTVPNSNAIKVPDSTYLNCVYDTTILIANDLVYEAAYFDNNKIYSKPLAFMEGAKVDFSKFIKLSDDSAFSIVTDNTYIYYNNSSGLHKMSLDGKDKRNISKDIGSNLYVSGDSIFYINKGDQNRLYKYSISENISRKITESAVLSYTLNGDSIIYINKDDNYRIYTISSDGKDNTKITDYSATSFTIGNNKIYYCNAGYDNVLFFSNLDGSGSSAFFEAAIGGEFLSCDKSGLYILNHNDFNRLYKVSYDGKKKINAYSEILTSYSQNDKYLFAIKKSKQDTAVIKKPQS